jgi:hypothetical protein
MPADFRRAGGHSPQNTLTMTQNPHHIETKKSYVVGGKAYTDLNAAKHAALTAILEDEEVANNVLGNAPEILVVLNLKANSRPRKAKAPKATPAKA